MIWYSQFDDNSDFVIIDKICKVSSIRIDNSNRCYFEITIGSKNWYTCYYNTEEEAKIKRNELIEMLNQHGKNNE